MAFNQQRQKSYAAGAATAFTAPLAAFSGSKISLNTVTANTVTSTAGLVIANAGSQFNIEWGSLVALVETDITTSTITVLGGWQVSADGTNWISVVTPGFPTGDQHSTNFFTQIAAAGTGSLVTTQYAHPFYGWNPSFDYVRYAVKPAVTTGGTGDSATVSYFWRKRSFLA